MKVAKIKAFSRFGWSAESLPFLRFFEAALIQELFEPAPQSK